VVASIGLSGGVINQDEYSIALLMVLVTTIIGSITYRRSVK